MPLAPGVNFLYDAEDGTRHNFSHASWRHSRRLFVAAAPFAELGSREVDMGEQMMALTSWLDLLCKCNVKHVVCLLDDESLWNGYRNIGDGDLASTCRGQGISFSHTPLHEGWPSLDALVYALSVLRRLTKSSDENMAIICRDGRSISAAVAAAWIVVDGDEDADSACKSVVESAREVGVIRDPLAPFAVACAVAVAACGGDTKEEGGVTCPAHEPAALAGGGGRTSDVVVTDVNPSGVDGGRRAFAAFVENAKTLMR
eukprot:TRINITY_DN61552_c0_g1_i1.p1 TRINITY_DN61552_c0_g1~~TRINITY_DN61552_c0_g1_i1.p1  ORF type:complete len:258 (+),score=51.75 TRINITY_DN61552_c0_g1_i1:150-923(+)